MALAAAAGKNPALIQFRSRSLNRRRHRPSRNNSRHERDPLLEWARRADARGVSMLGVLDRLVYPNLEPLMALAAATSVTDRITLTTAILISPIRTNTAMLAKQIATLDRSRTVGWCSGSHSADAPTTTPAAA